MLLFQTDGCPRDRCRFEWSGHGSVFHMDASWTPLDDQNDMSTTTTGSDAA